MKTMRLSLVAFLCFLGGLSGCRSKESSQEVHNLGQSGKRGEMKQSVSTAQAKPHAKVVPKNGCQDPNIMRCLADYAFNELEPTEINRLISVGIDKCFPSHEPAALTAYESCLPIDMGKDPRNGRMLQLRYTCSDECPSNGYVFLRYSEIRSKEECSAVGGKCWFDSAWGRWIGCVPPEKSGTMIGSCEPTAREIASRKAQECLKAAVPTVSVLSPDALRARVKEARSCFAPRGSHELLEQTRALPFTIALHPEDQRPIRLVYRCVDGCPGGRNVEVSLGGLTEWECCRKGEVPQYDDDRWHEYWGCLPHDLATKEDVKKSRCKQIDLKSPDPARVPRPCPPGDPLCQP